MAVSLTETMLEKYFTIRSAGIIALAGVAALITFSTPAAAQEEASGEPALIITNDPLPRDIKRQVYSKPVKVREIKPSEVAGRSYYEPTETLVSRKIATLHDELYDLQGRVASLSSELSGMQRINEEKAAEYYAAVATVSTQLQSGTTPGNPRLLKRLAQAEVHLEDLAQSIGQLNQMAISVAQSASEASFLLESTRATYGLSGAVEEDHVRLAELEDTINNTLVIIERLLDNVNDDITRNSTYLSSERHNLRTLALAVTNGDLYGKSLANKPFSSVGAFGGTRASYTPQQAAAYNNNPYAPYPTTQDVMPSPSGSFPAPQPYPEMEAIEPIEESAFDEPITDAPGAMAAPPMPPAPRARPQQSAAASSQMRPLVKIRFDRPNVEYEQPVYMAVNEALQRFPAAQFELVAIHPTRGNAAEVAIESTRARRNAERVLRTLTQMGLPLDRINLSYSESAEAQSSEVHLYIR